MHITCTSISFGFRGRKDRRELSCFHHSINTGSVKEFTEWQRKKKKKKKKKKKRSNKKKEREDEEDRPSLL